MKGDFNFMDKINEVYERLNRKLEEEKDSENLIKYLEEEILFVSNKKEQLYLQRSELEKYFSCKDWKEMRYRADCEIKDCQNIIDNCNKLINQLKRKILLDNLNKMHYND